MQQRTSRWRLLRSQRMAAWSARCAPSIGRTSPPNARASSTHAITPASGALAAPRSSAAPPNTTRAIARGVGLRQTRGLGREGVLIRSARLGDPPRELRRVERRVGRLADGLEGRGQRLGRVVQIITHAARARRELVARPPADVGRRRREGRHGRGPALYNGRGHGRRLSERPGHVGASRRASPSTQRSAATCAQINQCASAR